MKLAHKDIEKDNAGKVQTESSTGSVGSSRVRTTLTLCVATIDFDSQACQLRVKGTNIQENQYVKVRVHQDIATRSRYVRLVDNVKENGGNVRIFSSLHVSGEQLNQLSGVVAVLRFPIADMSEAEEDSSSDED
uniref:Protein pelota homolog n=1 Tax=Sinocyclocheilus grahami TaxID=75366 RepID=A0A672KCE3_SINGR